MKFRTEVEIDVNNVSIVPDSKITLLGSCFAAHIGRKMEESGLDAHVNPFGVLYNPLSIFAICDLIVKSSNLSDDYFVEVDGMWYCWLSDSSICADTIQACRERLEQICQIERERLKSLDYLFITLGTNRYYELRKESLVVGNCHKQPERIFEEKRLDIMQTICALQQTIDALSELSPSLRIVFTISPYRYAKYGFHESQIGKSVLLLATDELCKKNVGRCCYFPAYEILLDELRDYRFYAEDMLHPSESGVAYIWECFTKACFTEKAHKFVSEWCDVKKSLLHKPRLPESESYKKFFQKSFERLRRLEERYPHLMMNPIYKNILNTQK